ncbi:hypothetical protein D3C72_2051500 [compost metagenome]
MQNQLPVAEVHPLGVAGGTAGVEQCGQRVFVEVGKFELWRCSRQHGFVFAQQRHCLRGSIAVAEADDALDCRQVGA